MVTGVLNQFGNLRKLHFITKRTILNTLCEPVTNNGFLRAFNKLFYEFRVYRFVDVAALDRTANLSGVFERPDEHLLSGCRDVDVSANDRWVVTSHLKVNPSYIFSTGRHYFFPGRTTSGERHFRNVCMLR